MESIKNNPYRITGILANATERELQRKRTKLNAYMKVGKELQSDLDFSFLKPITRTNDSVVRAFSDIEQNQDKVNHALFWFLNVTPFDNTAIEYLKNGDEEKAIEIWAKVTDNKDINARNYSALNNLGTYKLLSNSANTVQEGIHSKLKLIWSEYFVNFVHDVADETFIIDQNKQSQDFIDILLKEFQGKYSNSQILKLFNTNGSDTIKYIKNKLTEAPIHKIELQIEACKWKRKERPLNAYDYGLNLYNETKVDLNQLQELLEKEDLKYKSVADHLANEIMQCGIDYFNENREHRSSGNYLESAQKLNKLAGSIAVGKLTKDRAKDNYASLEDMKDQELNKAILILQSVKGAYEKGENDVYRAIKEQGLSEWQIDWTKVNEVIQNTLDWDKVTEVIFSAIPNENIIAIKNSNNSVKLANYKELVNFILEKAKYSHRRKLNYLAYWQTNKSVSSSSRSPTSKPSSYKTTDTRRTSSSDEDGCAPWVYWVVAVIIIFFLLKAC